MTEQPSERANPQWRPLSEAGPFEEYYVWLLYGVGKTEPRPVVGVYRKGVFWGKEVKGWWGEERIGDNGRPSHGMWIDGCVLGWLPFNDPSMDAYRAERELIPAPVSGDGGVMAACPFCNSTDTFVERADYSSCYVICNQCGAKGPTCCNETEADVEAEDAGAEPGETAARRAWNRRASPSHRTDDAMREALKPFAIEAAEYDRGDNGEPDYDDAPDASSLNEINDLTVGDLRRARAAYGPTDNEQPEQSGTR